MEFYLKRMGREETFCLPPNKEKIIIGRSPLCDISFPSVHISRQHCQISRVPSTGALIIKNLKDTNCTYVNKLRLKKLEEHAELQIGCCIGLGVPLEHAVGAGMHNKNYVFLRLEKSLPVVEAQNPAKLETEGNAQIKIESQLGESSSDATHSGCLMRTTTPGQCNDAVTLPDHPRETTSLVQDGNHACTTQPGHPCKTSDHVQNVIDAEFSGHQQVLFNNVQGVGGNSTTSRQDNFEEEQRPSCSFNCDLRSRFVTTAVCPTSLVEAPVPMQEEISHLSITARDTVHVKKETVECVGESDKLRHTKPLESEIKNSPPYEVTPSIKTEDSKMTPVSVCEDMVIESKLCHSPFHIDLTKTDSNSAVQSSKKPASKECLIILSSSDDSSDEVFGKWTTPKKERESWGKRKRFTPDNSSGIIEIEEEGGSSNKKIKSSLIINSDRDSKSESDEGDSRTKKIGSFILDSKDHGKKNEEEGESRNNEIMMWSNSDSEQIVHNKGTNEQCPKDKPRSREAKIDKHSNEASQDSDTDQIFIYRKKLSKNAQKLNLNNHKQDKNSESLVYEEKVKQNSRRGVFSEVSPNSSDEEPLSHRRKIRNPRIICSSDSDSDFEEFPCRKGDAIEDLRINTKVKKCSVHLKRLSCEESLLRRVRNISYSEGTSEDTINNKENVSGDEMNFSSETCTNKWTNHKRSQKQDYKTKSKRRNSIEEENILRKAEGKLKTDGVHKEILAEPPSHNVSFVNSEDLMESGNVPLKTESSSSCSTSVCGNFADTEGKKRSIEKDHLSSVSNSEKEKKSIKEEQKVNNNNKVPPEIKVKVESSESCEENNSGKKNNKDVEFMYSQVGDEIWLSSEDEEDASLLKSPALPSLDADHLYFEEEDQHPNQREVNSPPVKEEDVAVEVGPEDAFDESDHWFPVLSQSFLQISDEEEEKGEDIVDDCKDQPEDPVESEPQPGPSGISDFVVDDDSEDQDSWWPQLSQGFLDELAEEEEDKEKEKASRNSCNELETRERDDSGSNRNTDLHFVLEKLQKKTPRTTKLIEAKVSHSPLESFYKRKSVNNNKKNLTTQEMSAKNKEMKQKQVECDRSSKPINKKTKPNKSNLRETLTSQFNLEAYKTTLEGRTKEKHHLNQDQTKSQKPPQAKKVENHKASANISIQKKKKSSDETTQDKPRPKVAAKVTKKTRFEKLIDVDLFSVPPSKTETSKKKTFKIPKSCNNVGSSSKSIPEAGSGLVLDSRKNKIGRCDKAPPLSVTEPQPKNLSNNAHTEIQILPTPSQSTSSDSLGKAGQVTKDLNKLNLKSKLTKKVHFPKKEEDLVKVKFISPLKNVERAGLPCVRAKEMLPEELKLRRLNIPPYYMELFVHHVCRWNYDWLESYNLANEKHRVGMLKGPPTPPPVVPSTNYPMLILYTSYKDYRETHSSLFYLELWEQIYKDWIKSRNSNQGLQSLIEYVNPTFMKTATGVLKFWTLKLLVALRRDQDKSMQSYRQGMLISLKIKKESKSRFIFGYVDHVMTNNRPMPINPQNSTDLGIGPSLTLGVRVVKDMITTVTPGTVITIASISYIRPSTRIWESLHKLPLFPLCQDILSPTPAVFSHERQTEYLLDLQLNEAQRKAVTDVSSKCMFDSHVPKVSLIHGPPGTGKTSTIVALIAQMAMIGSKSVPANMPRCKVLMCAPSNAAVDELTLRLIHLRNTGLSLRIVRIGFKADGHPVVKNYTLSQFVNKQVQMELSIPRCKSARQELQRRKILIEQLAEDLEKARKEGRLNEIKQLEIRLNEMVRSKAELEKSFINNPSAQERHKLHQKWEQELLLNAEVVTTTLSSCVSGTTAEVLARHPYHFTCCIVDEAGQCQETEILQPLLLGIRKLVLVGDHHQLPATVLSQKALSKNLQQSMFERFHHRLILELERDDLVHTLNIQYRMDPQIVKWPAYHFYQNKLLSESRIQSNISLKPYLIFDLKTSQEQRNQYLEMYNPAEASLVCMLLEVMEPHLGVKTVGVITPYQRQKAYLQEKLAMFKGRKKISVNTIDGFQGQERDVIVLSFVRANNSANIGFLSHRQRLNVALTRAKEVCYVVASLSSLEENREWHSLISNGRQRGVICTVTNKEERDKNFLKSVITK